MPLLRERFLEGMSRAATTVTIVTTAGPGGMAGVTVSAMASVSADSAQPSLLVCVNETSRTGIAIGVNRVFCVNILTTLQAGVSDVFAGRSATPSGDKFEGVAWRTLATGSPALDNSLVAFDCRLTESFRYGTHWILIGEVADVALHDLPGAPLIYANRGYGEPVPITATPNG